MSIKEALLAAPLFFMGPGYAIVLPCIPQLYSGWRRKFLCSKQKRNSSKTYSWIPPCGHLQRPCRNDLF